MLAGCSNRLQRGKVPKELPLIRHTLARGLRAPGPPRAALPGLAERKASGIPMAVVAGGHSVLAKATPEQARDIRAARRRLAGREHMGALFKALAITGAGMALPPGFE